MPASVRSVQAAHAACNLTYRLAAQISKEEWGKYGPAFVFFGVSESELEEITLQLGDQAECFYEPDLGNILTALAYCGPKRSEFEGLRLL